MEKTNNTIINLSHVNFYYNKDTDMEAHILKDINITAKQGEYISFFGPSGSGKSTLLNLISGIDKTSDGEIAMYNHDISKFSEDEMDRYRQVGIGFIFQNYNLIPSLKSIDNVTLPMSFIGVPRSERVKKAKEIFKKLDIEQLINRYPYELSGGQQQRVGIARALANDPHILLADEPIGNLDSVNAEKVLDLILDLNKKDGKTIVMVTHEAWSLRDVDTIFNIKDGVLQSTEKGRKLNKKEVSGLRGESSDIFTPKTKGEQSSMLASMVLNKYSVFEIRRFERLLDDRIEGKLTAKEFKEILDRPFKNGGVGLWKQSADRISNFVEKVIIKKGNREDITERIDKNYDFPIFEEIINIRNWLLEGVDTPLDSAQILKLDEIISDRIRNSIQAENFKKILNLSVNKGGVGLKIGLSLKILERMEIIMGDRIIKAKKPGDLIDASVTQDK